MATVVVQLPCCAVTSEKCPLDSQTCSLHDQVIPPGLDIKMACHLPTVQVEVLGVTVNALVDTGAAITLVDSIFHSIHPKLQELRLSPAPYSLKSAAQQPMACKGQIMLPLVMKDFNRSWPAIVTDNL